MDIPFGRHITGQPVLMSMRRLLNDKRGVSEIVGALMLTLIVVVAAGSFAVFVSQKQQSAQDQQLYDQQRQQEALAITGLKPVRNLTTGNFDQLNFTVASNHNLDSKVLKLTINNHVARDFWIWKIGQGAVKLNWTSNFVIGPQEQLCINITPINLFETGINFKATGYVEISISTGFQNSFTHVFMPPSAVISLSTETQWNASSNNYTDYLILDGSRSTAQADSFIVSYRWHIENATDSSNNLSFNGMKARADFPTKGANLVSLTVEDNHGMISVDSVMYYY